MKIVSIYLAIGKRIRSRREQHGLSRKQLALIAGVGEAYINKVECGYRRVSIEVIQKLAVALDVTLSEIFRGF